MKISHKIIDELNESEEKREMIKIIEYILNNKSEKMMGYALNKLYIKLGHLSKKYKDLDLLIVKIFEKYKNNENIVKSIFLIMGNSNSYTLYEHLLKQLLQSDDKNDLKVGLQIIKDKFLKDYQTKIKTKPKLIPNNDVKFILNLLFKSYNKFDDEEIKLKILWIFDDYPMEKRIIIFIENIINSSSNLNEYKKAVHTYSRIVLKDFQYLSGFIRTYKPNKFNLMREKEWMIDFLEKLVKEQEKERKDIVFQIYLGLIRNRDALLEPELKKELMTIKYDYSLLNKAPTICNIIRDIVTEKNLKEPHYGWFYNRYEELEKQFTEINNYIPLTESIFAPNFKFGSPKLVELHIQLGTMIDSTLKTYGKIINDRYMRYPRMSKRDKFGEGIKKLHSIFNICNKKLTLKNYPITIKPFKSTLQKNPKWYQIYSAKKHDLIEMEKQTKLKYLLDALGAFYILVVYHPDNWNSIEFDWDSKIFDKYQIRPII